MSKPINATPELPQNENVAEAQLPEQLTLTEQAISLTCPADCGYFDKDGERAYYIIGATKEDSGLYGLGEYGNGWKLLFSHQQAPAKKIK